MGDNTGFSIISAGLEHVELLAPLFDSYRQFYQEPANLALARSFLHDNIASGRATVFLALSAEGPALGFTQLYHHYCSVAARPYLLLYDLFVAPEARRSGVARALMTHAQMHGQATGACRIDLETALDNHRAQALYESLGYCRDTVFYKYSLPLAPGD